MSTYDKEDLAVAESVIDSLQEENQRLRDGLEWIQRNRMIVGEAAYIKARDTLGNQGKSYAEIYNGQDDPTVAFIKERQAPRKDDH